MEYLYETHLHTNQASACGKSRGREYISRYKDLGYTGIIVTDHFYRGCSALSQSLPWPKWVDAFCRGYEDAREEGERRGLDVFFGWEETYDGDDYLVYGLDKDWLLQHPEVRRWTRKEQFDQARRCGGCVVHAHPFRQYYYLSGIRLYGCVDAVEAANGGNQRSFDALAWAYAKKIGVPVLAGTDIHRVDDAYHDSTFGVYLDKKMENITDYVKAVKNNNISGLKVPEGRFDICGNERVLLPVDIRDNMERKIKKNIFEFLELTSN